MKRLLTTTAALALAGAVWAGYPEGYYSRMDGKVKEDLKAAAKACVKNHTRLEYYELPNYWQYSDVYPELVNGMRRWWDMYSDAVYLIAPGQSGKQSFSANKMQREHAIPKSWWKRAGDVEYTPAYSDMWNLYPSDASANQAKLNYAFGETRSTTFNNGVTKVGAPKAGYGGGSSSVFEPADEYKGDFARAIFYMATVYDDLPWAYDYMFVSNSYPSLVPWAANMLLDWARRDPVSQKEIDRNDRVEQYQGNRNPFIDFPQLAEYIWGAYSTQTFVIADQPNTGTPPVVSGDPEITAPVTGETLDFGQWAVGVTARRALQITGHNLTQPLSLRIVGSAREAFEPEVNSLPATTINTNGGFLLNINYAPASTGIHEAKLTLYDGGLEGSIVVNLHGEALEAPALETLHANQPSDLTESGYTASWDAPSGIADYYVLTRVRHTQSGNDIETFETGETSYRLERDPAVAESYYVAYNRLGLESPQSNVVYVAPAGLEERSTKSPVTVCAGPDGLIILAADGQGGEIRVYDASGRFIVREDSPADGQRIPLPRGLYIVKAGGRVFKICI